MKYVIAIAALLFANGAGAQPAKHRPVIEHLGAPALNGQRLPFSTAVRVGDIIYFSGQIGDRGGILPTKFGAQARLAMDSLGQALNQAGVSWKDVFHCTVTLSDMANWPAFNKIYVTYFPDGQYPARNAFGVNGIALGAMVEIECQAYAGKE